MKTMTKIKETMELILDTFGLFSVLADKDGNIIHTCGKDVFENLEDTLHLFTIDADNVIPQIRMAPYFQNYIGIPDKEYEGMIIFGPSVPIIITEAMFRKEHVGLTVKEKGRLVAYYQKLPVVSWDKLNHIAKLIYYMVYGKVMESESIMEYNFYKSEIMLQARKRFGAIVSKAAIEEKDHHSYEAENELLSCIRQGDTKKLLIILSKPLDGEIGVLHASDPLRSRKNMVISLASIATRIAIEEGVPPMLSYGMNDTYVQMVEETGTILEIHSLFVTMLCNYSDVIREHRQSSYSKLVRESLDYIYSSLYKEISVQEMADKLHFNKHYLNRIFKEEIGMTITSYIKQEKVEEAKKLLAFTKYSIIDIVDLLCFHDQSHFTKVFREVAGTTPKRYRSQH